VRSVDIYQRYALHADAANDVCEPSIGLQPRHRWKDLAKNLETGATTKEQRDQTDQESRSNGHEPHLA
jgi:hypothetical protein